MSIQTDQAQLTSMRGSGAAYEALYGRWNRLVAGEFLPWLNFNRGVRWIDIGSNTGALSRAIIERAYPTEVKGVDSAEEFASYARDHVKDERLFFKVGDLLGLPFETERYDMSVSGLMLNFMSEPERMIAEMVRVVRKDGTIALYVWDYASGMQMLRLFWQVAATLDPSAVERDEGRRFTMCRPQTLERLFTAAALGAVEVGPILIPMEFKDFDDYWNPFLSGGSPAAAYAQSLAEDVRETLAKRLKAVLPHAVDGTITLFARAWAVKGIKGS